MIKSLNMVPLFDRHSADKEGKIFKPISTQLIFQESYPDTVMITIKGDDVGGEHTFVALYKDILVAAENAYNADRTCSTFKED